jgi:hypothetical protein
VLGARALQVAVGQARLAAHVGRGRPGSGVRSRYRREGDA